VGIQGEYNCLRILSNDSVEHSDATSRIARFVSYLARFVSYLVVLIPFILCSNFLIIMRVNINYFHTHQLYHKDIFRPNAFQPHGVIISGVIFCYMLNLTCNQHLTCNQI
jgi:hypothetical protein